MHEATVSKRQANRAIGYFIVCLFCCCGAHTIELILRALLCFDGWCVLPWNDQKQQSYHQYNQNTLFHSLFRSLCHVFTVFMTAFAFYRLHVVIVMCCASNNTMHTLIHFCISLSLSLSLHTCVPFNECKQDVMMHLNIGQHFVLKERWPILRFLSFAFTSDRIRQKMNVLIPNRMNRVERTFRLKGNNSSSLLHSE